MPSRIAVLSPKFAIFVALLALIACEEQATRVAPSPGSNPRVVSLVPAVTEMLFAMGAGPQVVGVGSFDSWPPDVEGLPRVGALLDPDVERIIRLRPDLVVIHASQDDVEEQLGRLGIRTFSYALGGLDNVTATMRRLGPAVGRAEGAEAAARRIEEGLQAVRERAEGEPRPRVLLVFGREPGTLRALDASGGIGFLHDILTLAGGENVYAGEPREAVRVSSEALLAARPEVIIEFRYGRQLTELEVESERRSWDALPALPAVRDGRVFVLTGNHLVVPGPRVVETAEEIARVLAR